MDKEDLYKAANLDFLIDIMDSSDEDYRFKSLHALSGIIKNDDEEVLFVTIFVKRRDVFTPLVLTSKGEVIEVIDRVNEIMQNGVKPDGSRYNHRREVPPNEHFYYFKYNNVVYKYAENLFYDEVFNIHTISNDVVDDIVNKKKYTKAIYDYMLRDIKAYYDNPLNYEFDVLNTCAIQSYIYQILGRVFYLVLIGGPGSGKTTALILLSHLQYNGFFGGKGTVPSSCRLIHFLGISLCQDEFEKMSREEKQMFVGVFNTGFNREGRYTITNLKAQGSRQVQSFITFSPKSFTCNDLTGFDITFIDRAYVMHSIKANKSLRDIHQLKEEDLQRFQDHRNKMFVYCVLNWKEIREDINEMKAKLESEGVFGREVDKNSIILGIIKHFKGEDYALKIKKDIKEKAPLLQLEHAISMEDIILESIVKVYEGKYKPIITIENDYLYGMLLMGLGMDKKDKFAPSNQKPRKILDTLGLTLKEENIGYNKFARRVFHINTEQLRNVLSKNGRKILYNLLPSPTKLPKPLSDFTKESKESKETKDRVYNKINWEMEDKN